MPFTPTKYDESVLALYSNYLFDAHWAFERLPLMFSGSCVWCDLWCFFMGGKNSIVKRRTKSHLRSLCFYWILCCTFACGHLSYKNNHTRKLNIFAFLSSFRELLSLPPCFSLFFTRSSSFMGLHQLTLINCLERFGDITDFKNWFLYHWSKFAFCIDLSRPIFLAEDSNIHNIA